MKALYIRGQTGRVLDRDKNSPADGGTTEGIDGAEEAAAGVALPWTEPILCADRSRDYSTRDARSEDE